MSASSIPTLLTVAEFAKLPVPPQGHYELHHGEVVLVTPPVHSHKLLQRRLRVLLEDAADANGYVADTEYAYRPLPENEVWVADVACVSAAREMKIEKWLEGSPELVIEVKSPGNSQDQLADKAMTTLAGDGCHEFWIVNPENTTVTVYSRATGIHLYQRGSKEAIPVPLFDMQITVNQVFDGISSTKRSD